MGRDVLIADMERAFDKGGSGPNLFSLFIGPRGVGKTALMSHLANVVPQYGWIAANVSARPGMLEDILEHAAEAANEFVDRGADVRVKSLNIGQLFGMEWEYRDPSSGNWHTRGFSQLHVKSTANVATVGILVDSSSSFHSLAFRPGFLPGGAAASFHARRFPGGGAGECQETAPREVLRRLEEPQMHGICT